MNGTVSATEVCASAVAKYPFTPGAKASGPSRESALSERVRAPLLRERVICLLKDNGPSTADACAAAMCETVLSVRPRFSELLKMGRIEDSGGRRRKSGGGPPGRRSRMGFTTTLI